MEIITLLNQKGGVGKTTLAVHIAAGLAIRGAKVILIDTDAQANVSTALKMPERPMVHDWLVRNARWQDSLLAVPKARFSSSDTGCNGELALMPGNIETRSIPLLISDPLAIHYRMLEIEKQVDVVVIDTSPTPSLLHGVIYMATDWILYPVVLSGLAIDGLVKSTGHREAATPKRRSFGLDDIKIMGIVPNMFKARHNAQDSGLTELVRLYDGKVWEPLPERTTMVQASFAQRTIFAYDPCSDAADHMWNVVRQVQRVMWK